MDIIAQGRSTYQILAPHRYAEAELYAAQTLQTALFRMTGVRLPVRYNKQRVTDHPAIIIGAEQNETAPGLWDKDSYAIVPRGMDLLLSGSTLRACHYAVNAFLETLGVRFFGPDNSVYPQRKQIALPTRPIRSTAAFGYRHVFYPTAQEPEWALRWKLNVHDGCDRRWGANARAHSMGHSFSALVPIAKYFATHPEYFSLVDGRRRDHQQQLCATNPDVAEVAAETIAGWIAAQPHHRIFAVGMNDWLGWCECPTCARVDRREGGPTGQLLTLVNRVADRFPDRIIATLAYSWALDPPRTMRARDNVLIVLCHNRGCFTHPLKGCTHNRDFVQCLEGWQRKSQHILIWDYFVNYHSYLMPTPNLARIEQDIRLYRDAGIAGIFCQGSACRGGQFEELRQYLLARCLWNPDVNVWAEADEWLRGVYGDRAGAAILDYLELLHRHVARNNVHMRSFGSGQEVNHELFTPDILKRGKLLWDKAERAAGSAELRRKVFAARAPEMCSRLFHANLEYRITGDRIAPRPTPDHALKERFVQAALLDGAAHLREDDGAPEDFARNYGRSYHAVILQNAQLRAVVAPELGGRIYSLQYRPAGLELLRTVDLTTFVNYFPYDAGYEFAVDGAWRGLGTNAEYSVQQRSATQTTLRADLSKQLRITTMYVLQGGQVIIRHRITNRGRQPVVVTPYTHPEWNAALFDGDACLHMRTGAGAWHSQPLNPEKRSYRNLEFAGDAKPRGGWRIVTADGTLAIDESFDDAAVTACRLNVSPARGNVNFELAFRPTTIAPKATVEIATSWRIGSPAD